MQLGKKRKTCNSKLVKRQLSSNIFLFSKIRCIRCVARSRKTTQKKACNVNKWVEVYMVRYTKQNTYIAIKDEIYILFLRYASSSSYSTLGTWCSLDYTLHYEYVLLTDVNRLL